MDHLPLLLLDDPLLLTDIEEELQLLLGDERATHAVTPGRGADDQPRHRTQAADKRPEHPGQEQHRPGEHQREGLVEPQRERLRRDLAEDQHDDREDERAHHLRNSAEIAWISSAVAVETTMTATVLRVRMVDRYAFGSACRRVTVRARLLPSSARLRMRMRLTLVNEVSAAAANAATTRPEDDDDDERRHRLGDGGGSEPLTGTVRSRSVLHGRARSPRRSAARPRGCGAWAHRRNCDCRCDTGSCR